MNLSDFTRTRIFISSIQDDSSWKGHLTKAIILALGFGTYVALLRKGAILCGGTWCLHRLKSCFSKKRKEDPVEEEISDKPVVTFNQEICPICIGVPKVGVRAPCGHLLCADCLAKYCDVRMMSSPPPCPLCRAPLDSLVLTYDMATIISPMMVDANVDANTRAWVRDYNLRRGLIAPPRTSLVWTFLAHHACVIAYVITLALILGLVAVRIKILPWTGWIGIGSVVDILLGVALMICVWLKYQEQYTIFE